MARDYKTRANPGTQKKKEQPCRGGIWFFAGLMVGLFIAGLAWLKLGPTLCEEAGPPPVAVQPKASVEQEKESKSQEVSTAPKPRFDFYTLLPEMEVVVPDQEEEEQPTSAPVKATKQLPAASGAFILQMGSFRKYSDADRLKASLALMGIEAEIQRVNINDKETYHRVRSRPYRDQKQITALRKRLKEAKINSLLIKLKQ